MAASLCGCQAKAVGGTGEHDFLLYFLNHAFYSDLGSAACQPSAEAGAGPVAERARVDEFDAVGREALLADGETSELWRSLYFIHGARRVGAG